MNARQSFSVTARSACSQFAQIVLSDRALKFYRLVWLSMFYGSAIAFGCGKAAIAYGVKFRVWCDRLVERYDGGDEVAPLDEAIASVVEAAREPMAIAGYVMKESSRIGWAVVRHHTGRVQWRSLLQEAWDKALDLLDYQWRRRTGAIAQK